MEFFEKLQNIISEVLSISTDEITMGTTFVDDLGADSLDVYQIIMAIEEEFEIVGEEVMAALPDMAADVVSPTF